jgi:hypothetical protein
VRRIVYFCLFSFLFTLFWTVRGAKQMHEEQEKQVTQKFTGSGVCFVFKREREKRCLQSA